LVIAEKPVGHAPKKGRGVPADPYGKDAFCREVLGKNSISIPICIKTLNIAQKTRNNATKNQIHLAFREGAGDENLTLIDKQYFHLK
jgi:hypothetical protein